jgi:hypothetical protein
MSVSEVDMSRIANGGHPAALVSGTVIQELDAQRNAGGSIVLAWEGTSAGVYVEHNPGFSPGAWTEIAGPIMGNSWTNTTPPVDPAGNYRLRLQPGKP